MSIDWCGSVNGVATAVGSLRTGFGPCTVVAHAQGIVAVDWAGSDVEVSEIGNRDEERLCDAESLANAIQIAENAVEQLEQYFSGTRQSFALPLVLKGTPFQRAVWEYLQTIPYGETRSYADVAIAIGRGKAVRAVGQANRANPIPIIIPCHRVIGRNGALTGYAGSQVHLKAALLNLERGVPADMWMSETTARETDAFEHTV